LITRGAAEFLVTGGKKWWLIPRVGVWQQLQFAAPIPAEPDGNDARIVLVVQLPNRLRSPTDKASIAF
jgi:hypothetical protein